MKSELTFLSFCAVTLALSAGPRVDQDALTVVQSKGDCLVTVDYVLRGDPGIVTVDFQTNVTKTATGPWVSIGVENFKSVAGDVNRLVKEVDETHRITWQPTNDWANVRVRNGNFRAVVTAWATNAPPDYMVIDLLTTNFSYYVSKEALPLEPTNETYKTTSLVMRRVHAANVEWTMGSSSEVPYRGNGGRYNACETMRRVTLSSDYYLGIFELTQEQRRILSDASGYFGEETKAPNVKVLPVQYMDYTALRGSESDSFRSWPLDGRAVAPNSWFDSWRKKIGVEFDLPTEAEWEFACRAGTNSGLNSGKELTSSTGTCANLAEVGWYNYNKYPYPSDWSGYDVRNSEVGLLKPNAWGFYDMHGNVSEFVLDRGRQAGTVVYSFQRDPVGDETGTAHIIRGSSIAGNASLCSSYARDEMSGHNRYTGLRVRAPAIGVK